MLLVVVDSPYGCAAAEAILAAMSDESSSSKVGRTVLRGLQHDLRTPLGQILGYSEMLQEELEERQHEDLLPDLKRIMDAARTLLAMVDSMAAADQDLRREEHSGDGSGAAELQHQSEQPSPTTGSLLVVDDNAHNTDMLSRRLIRKGYQAEVAEDGPSALRLVEENDYDLIILDVSMPGMSGIEVLDVLRKTHTSSELPVILATALDSSEDTVTGLKHGANDYVTKPLDFPVLLARIQSQLSLRRATRQVQSLAQQLELRNAALRRIFGRYSSDEIVANLLESDEGLELSGEKRRVSILMTDLRGFSSLTQQLEPLEVVSILNRYLGTMADIVQSFQGTVDEFIGDAVLAFFGAPLLREDDAERAVACALAMQKAIGGINADNRSQGLPEIEMGVGIATGEVIVGNIGSESRAKYGAVGTPVNLAARIESYTLGGQVLIDDETLTDLNGLAVTAESREVLPKGFDGPVLIHRITGMRGTHASTLVEQRAACEPLSVPIRVEMAKVEGKDVTEGKWSGQVWARSAQEAKIHTESSFEELTSLRIQVVDEHGAPQGDAFYARVTADDAAGDDSITVRLTGPASALPY